MSRKTRSPIRSMLERGGLAGLAVKDGVRGARFTVKQGARRLAHEVKSAAKSAAKRSPQIESIRSISTLVEPLEFAARTTVELLKSADHALFDALSADGPFRAMSVPLRPSNEYFRGDSVDLRGFTQDHFWRYRHWAVLAHREKVFVHELEIERAGEQVGERVRSGLEGSGARAGASRPLSATDIDAELILALGATDIFSPPLGADQECAPPAHQLAWPATVTVVLAGAIAGACRTAGRPIATLDALVLGKELASGGREAWERALRAADPAASLSTWLASVLRHV